MDPFTQRMLERTKMRREKLQQHFSKQHEIGLRQPLCEKNSCNDINLKEEVVSNDFQKSRELKIPEVSGIDSENSENELLRKWKEQCDSHIEFNDNTNNDDKVDHGSRPCKFGRLAELASKIRQWEDELEKPKPSTCADDKKNYGKGGMKKNEKNSNKSMKPCEEEKKEKKIVWDKAVIKSLESQGYELSKNESRLIYDFERKGDKAKNSESCNSKALKLQKSPSKSSECSSPKIDRTNKSISSPRKNDGKDSGVLKKAAFFESQTRSSPSKIEKDPVELSIAERKALFEKNAGEALLPKVAFATPLPAKLANAGSKTQASPYSSSIGNIQPVTGVDKIQPKKLDYSKAVDNELQMKQIKVKADRYENENNVKIQKERFEKGICSTKDAQKNIDILTREKELEYLKNRWDRNKNISEAENPMLTEIPSVKNSRITDSAPVINHNIPVPPPMSAFSVNALEMEINQSKILKDDENNSRRLYPSLSEFEESDDSDRPTTDSDSLNQSNDSNIYLNMTFSDILEAKKNDPTSSNEHSFNAELRESQVLSKMDEFLDNALNELSSDGYDSGEQNTPSPPKMLKSSSFEYKSISPETSVNPLVHTVSFYRKQQQTSNHTPNSVKSIKMEEDEVEKGLVEEETLVENKIQELLQEINKQQTIISQASQALNLCLSTIEFSGSGEQVESERLLLLANHKRQACLNEIQRLKVEKSVRPKGSNQQLTEKGDVIITDISVPLKRDALRAMAAVESMLYLVCLIKSDERVVATPAVPATRENLKNTMLCFPGQYKLENLLSDFKVTIEVYNLELNKEMLPHEIKYHIVNKKDKRLLTPIKSKKAESKLVVPYVQSPAGPSAVRSSNFQLCGYVVFSLREVTRTHWTLNKVPYTSSLDGSFSMKIKSQLQLDTEFRGFLTMFDDISGFGAWHRRWCLLSSHTLSYWKYPDDETRKIPIGTIDLRAVITENVGLVSRDICARLHTFLLETTRARQDNDKESLVVNVQGDVTRIRHLLSADSKEEMLTWCRKMNTTLALLRSWRCNFNI